jgi:hypothetical protein
VIDIFGDSLSKALDDLAMTTTGRCTHCSYAQIVLLLPCLMIL